MADSTHSTTSSVIEKRLKQGRGQGRGADYKPWLTIQDVSSTGRPIWLTKTAITKKIGIRKLLSDHQDKLPLTVKALDELVETQPEYAVRRLWWATNCFLEENICPTRVQLLLRASLKPATVALPLVKAEIDKALDIFSRVNT